MRSAGERRVLGCLVYLCGSLCVLFCWAAWSGGRVEAARGEQGKHGEDEAGSRAAFVAMLPVLRHPRCIVCHAGGDFPRQGDDLHPHLMNVRRGADGHGVAGVKCATCHQDHNLPGVHMPPGAPDWGLPPAATPMVWQGLTDRQLCELLKDPQQNGHRTGEKIVEHMSTPLVQWAWHPGEGRTPVPMPSERFVALSKVWVEKGAACP